MSIEDAVGYVIYGVQGLTALWGAFCVVMVITRVGQKQFASEEAQTAFLEQLEKPLAAGKFDEAIAMCEGDQRAVPQLAWLALTQRNIGYSKVRQMLLDRFQRDVMADLEFRVSWINTVIKSAPMLGLFGTVVGMSFAFGRMATGTNVDSVRLASDISLALNTTIVGLAVAIPLILCLSDANLRIRAMEDLVTSGVTRFLEAYRAALNKYEPEHRLTAA